MALPFEHTRRALAAMKLRSTAVSLLVASAAFGAWLVWLLFGHVSVYVKSSSGRLEVTPPPMPLNAAVEGLVASCNLSLGAHVDAGDLLVQLDSTSYKLQADEARATLTSDQATLTALRTQLNAELTARDAMSRVLARTERTGELKVEANRAASVLKQQENDMMTKLSAAELASKLDSIRSRSESEAQRLQVRVSSEQAALDTSNAKMSMQDRNIRVSTLQTQIVGAENEVNVEAAKLKTLEYEVERRQIRAFSSGIINDAIACAPGMSVTPSTRFGTLLPEGEVRLVAYYQPRDVVGRAQPGQKAIIRVDNFPWTQFGTLEGTVRSVGSEPRDNLVRVDLSVDSLNATIPAIHGLIATCEIEIEQLTPARLLMRLAGQMLMGPPQVAAPTIDTGGVHTAER